MRTKVGRLLIGKVRSPLFYKAVQSAFCTLPGSGESQKRVPAPLFYFITPNPSEGALASCGSARVSLPCASFLRRPALQCYGSRHWAVAFDHTLIGSDKREVFGAILQNLLPVNGLSRHSLAALGIPWSHDRVQNLQYVRFKQQPVALNLDNCIGAGPREERSAAHAQ